MHQETISEAKYRKMMETPIPKLVSSLAIPTTISTMITVIYNTADTYFVSQINESASAAVGVAYSIMAILQAVGYGLAMGSGSLISRYLGKKMDKEACGFAASGFYASMLVGLVAGGICLAVLEPLLRLIGASDTMMPYAVPYARIILMGAPMSCASFVVVHLLRAEGNTKLAMWSSLSGGLLNLVLDPLLIFGCNMGTAGAALATAASQLVNFIIPVIAFSGRKTILSLHPRYISRSWKTYGQIISTGSPTILRQGLGSLSATVLNISAVVYGDATVAAITISGKIYTLVRQLIMGIGQGFQPVAGYNYGAGNKKRAYGAFKFAVLLGTGICTVAAVLIAIFAEPIMWWFCDSGDVARIGTETLLISCAVMPLLGFSTFVNQLYQCLGFSKIASFLASCRQGLFFIPCILILPRFLDALGVEATQSIADLMTFLVSIPFAIRFYRRIVKPAQETV